MPEPSGPQRVLVPFSGSQTGTAPLTWGQRAVWQGMQACGHSLCLAEFRRMPDGATAEDVAAQFAGLVSRYPALRTRFEAAPGGPDQVVHGSGEVAVDIVTMPEDATPRDVLRYTLDLEHRQETAPIDPYRDWPVQLTLVRHGGALAYRVFTVSRLVADGIALAMLREELNSARPPARAEAMTPLDLARRELTEPLRRVSDRAMRYWEGRLRSAPPPPVTFRERAQPGDQPGHRYRRGLINSSAAALALRAIAERTGADTARVLYAVIATAIARATGSGSVATRLTVSNRFRPGYSEIVGPLSQESLVTLDVGDAGIDEVIARAGRAILAAGMYGYYDPRQLDQVLARAAAERRQPAGITWVVNDTRSAVVDDMAEPASSGRVTREQITQKLPGTLLNWADTTLGFDGQALIEVFDHPEVLVVRLILDTARFSEQEAEGLLRGIEEAAVAAALDLVAPTGIRCG